MTRMPSLVSLAIAFESLLGLPEAEKTERLVDSIALLLGRLPRLDAWARQFYEARSRIVHEGRAGQLLFVAGQSQKGGKGATYQPLLSYGRRVFRLCLATLLLGSELAEQAGLEDRLITNQERFEKICQILEDDSLSPSEGLAQLEGLVAALEQYRFLSEGGLRLETMLGATRRVARALLACDDTLSDDARQDLAGVAHPIEDDEHFGELSAISKIQGEYPVSGPQAKTVFRLLKVVWHYTFIHYYALESRAREELERGERG